MFKKVPMGIAALTFLSEDVRASKAQFRPYSGTAPWYKTASEATWVTPDWNVGYYVPNFGVDHDIISTQAHIAKAESKLKHKLYANLGQVRAQAKADEDIGPAPAQSLG